MKIIPPVDIFHSLELSEDLTLKKANIYIIEQHSIAIDNYKCIQRFTNSEATILTHNGSIVISGKMLKIVYYNNQELKMQGLISRIQFNP